MKIPNFIDAQFVNKDGYLTDTWKQILQQLLQQMSSDVSDEGFIVPQQPTSNLPALSKQQSVGAIVYDSTTDQFKVCVKAVVSGQTVGQFKIIQVA